MFLSQKQTNVNFILSIGTRILNGTYTINRDVQQYEEIFSITPVVVIRKQLH